MQTLQLIQQKRQQLQSLEFEKFWQIGPSTGQLLKDYILKSKAHNVLELGSSSGYSGLWIAEALLETGGQLFTIESHLQRHQTALPTFENAGVSNFIHAIRDHAPEVFTRLPRPNFDLIFIDCTKQQTTEIFQEAYKVLQPLGYILIDNINSHKDSFADFFCYLKAHNYTYEIIDIDAGVLVFQKK